MGTVNLIERVHRCPHFVSYDSVGGPMAYCDLAAFEHRIHSSQLRLVGCTEELRSACGRMIELACGFKAAATPADTISDTAADHGRVRSRAGGEGR
jgi:hypothetical protein